MLFWQIERVNELRHNFNAYSYIFVMNSTQHTYAICIHTRERERIKQNHFAFISFTHYNVDDCACIPFLRYHSWQCILFCLEYSRNFNVVVAFFVNKQIKNTNAANSDRQTQQNTWLSSRSYAHEYIAGFNYLEFVCSSYFNLIFSFYYLLNSWCVISISSGPCLLNVPGQKETSQRKPTIQVVVFVFLILEKHILKAIQEMPHQETIHFLLLAHHPKNVCPNEKNKKNKKVDC